MKSATFIAAVACCGFCFGLIVNGYKLKETARKLEETTTELNFAKREFAKALLRIYDTPIPVILRDQEYWSGLLKRGVHYQILDGADPACEKLSVQLDKHPAPCMILIDGSKTEHNWLNTNPDDMKVPLTREEFDSVVDRFWCENLWIVIVCKSRI